MNKRNREIPTSSRIAAVRAVEGGQSPTDVAKELGVSTESIRNWRKQFGATSGGIRATSARRTTVETLSTTELQADNRALRELVGALVFGAWQSGQMNGADILQQIQTMRPQTTSHVPVSHMSEVISANANGAASLPQ
jgi:transposase-like protein